MIGAALAVADGRVAHEALAAADAVVFEAVVRLAVAAFAHGGVQSVDLVGAGLDSRLSLVVLAADALAHSWNAGKAPLQADAVQLVAGALVAVAAR